MTLTGSEMPASSHPTERSLRRFAANETGGRLTRIVASHVENCAVCRQIVIRAREINRRFRDFERTAIAQAVSREG